jgi:hypothetical protein
MDKQPPKVITTVTTDVMVVDSVKEVKRKRVLGCCKKFFRILFSHLGLFALVVLYTCVGGFIFEHLETTNEKNICIKQFNKYIEAENDTIGRLWEVSTQGLDEYDTKISFKRILEKFRDRAVSIEYAGTNCTMMGEEGGTAFQWSWAGALMFSVTVITTIGR